MLNKFFDKIFYINLERRPDRNKEIIEELKRFNIDAERFNAVDSALINKPDNWIDNRGSYACLQSHLEILKMSKILGYNKILILEDDVIFNNNINDIIELYFNEVPEDWDILYLSGNHNEHCGYSINKISDHIIKCNMTYSTHSYAVDSKMYDYLIEILDNGTKPIDVIYSDIQKVKNCYSFYPGISSQRNGYSDIINNDVDYTRYIK